MWARLLASSWTRLVGALDRGRVDFFITEREVMVGLEMEEVRELWAATGDRWNVDGEWVVRAGREEEGWREVQQILNTGLATQDTLYTVVSQQ